MKDGTVTPKFREEIFATFLNGKILAWQTPPPCNVAFDNFSSAQNEEIPNISSFQGKKRGFSF